jgi:hypothetical protein
MPTGSGSWPPSCRSWPGCSARTPRPRLAALAGDVGWVTAVIRTLGVDAVLAELKTAGVAAPREPRLAAMHAVVRGQAHHLRDRETVGDPGFVPRQLCLQAAELGETLLAADCRTRLLAFHDPGPVLQWTTQRASPALTFELGCHSIGVDALAVLPDGRLASAGDDVLVWDPADPGAGPVELGRHDRVWVLAVLPDGRVASGGEDGVLVWDVQNGTARSLIACSAYAFATSPSPSGAYLFIGHASGGISCWEVRAAAQNTPGTRQHAG